MISRKVRRLVSRRNFKLPGSNFVMTRFDGNPKFEEFALHIQHEGEDALRYRSKVMIFKFLTLRRLRTKKRCLAVQHISRPGDKCGRYAKSCSVWIFQNVGRACYIPRGIAARFGRRSEAAARKA